MVVLFLEHLPYGDDMHIVTLIAQITNAITAHHSDPYLYSCQPAQLLTLRAQHLNAETHWRFRLALPRTL
jgi:hypothetical protein